MKYLQAKVKRNQKYDESSVLKPRFPFNAIIQLVQVLRLVLLMAAVLSKIVQSPQPVPPPFSHAIKRRRFIIETIFKTSGFSH